VTRARRRRPVFARYGGVVCLNIPDHPPFRAAARRCRRCSCSPSLHSPPPSPSGRRRSSIRNHTRRAAGCRPSKSPATAASPSEKAPRNVGRSPSQATGCFVCRRSRLTRYLKVQGTYLDFYPRLDLPGRPNGWQALLAPNVQPWNNGFFSWVGNNDSGFAWRSTRGYRFASKMTSSLG